jgi:ATP-dependent Clp protease ATP-binding subunit ClpB
MKAQWLREKELIEGARREAAHREGGRHDLDRPPAPASYEDAGRIKYEVLPGLERSSPRAGGDHHGPQAGGRGYLKEEVTAEDIAEIVAKWTGIPVRKMLESEQQRLL